MLRFWRKRQVQIDPETLRAEQLNAGLALAMEWGENWLKPIQPRLRLRYPQLSQAELDQFNRLCQEAMKFGHDTVYELAMAAGNRVHVSDFEPVFKARYPWADNKNITHLFSQGMYYAWKDGGLT